MSDKTISPETFLEHMAQSDESVDHDGETCGMCHHMRLGAEVAREMIAAGGLHVPNRNLVSEWEKEQRRRWEDSKFFKLWQEERAAGREPNKAFEERGWEA